MQPHWALLLQLMTHLHPIHSLIELLASIGSLSISVHLIVSPDNSLMRRDGTTELSIQLRGTPVPTILTTIPMSREFSKDVFSPHQPANSLVSPLAMPLKPVLNV